MKRIDHAEAASEFIAAKAHQEFHDRRLWDLRLKRDREARAIPEWEELRAEDREEEPAILLTVLDGEGGVVRRLSGPTAAGLHRLAWDLRFPPSVPVSLEKQPDDNPFSDPPRGSRWMCLEQTRWVCRIRYRRCSERG